MPKVLLVQLPVPSFAHNWTETRNVPLAAGYLKGTALSSVRSGTVEIEILDRVSADLKGDAFLLDTILSRDPGLVGFTCASWNLARSLYLAEKLKSILPGCTVVAGGPEVGKSSSAILENPAVDIGVGGEGEGTFAEVLSGLFTRGPALGSIRGIFFRRGGKRVFTGRRDPLPNLGVVPSPYLCGFIDAAEYGNMTLETMRGCPHRCKYCSYPKRSPRVRKFPLGRVEAEIRTAITKGLKRVNIIDPSFESANRLREVCLIIARLNPESTLSLFTDLRAEAVDDESAEWLSRANFTSVEVGLQSSNPRALERVGRRLDPDAFLRGVARMREREIEVRVNVIVGLPGDTPDGIRETLRFIETYGLAECAVPSILQVLPNTALREEAERLGIVYQKEPPYYVLGTGEMDYGEIRAAVRLCEKRLPLATRLATPFIEVPSLATYASARFPSTAPPPTTADVDRMERPVTKVVIDLSDGAPLPEGILTALSRKLSAAPVLWFVTRSAGREADRMERVLTVLSLHNPYLAWNVVVETSAGFHPGLFDRLKAAVFCRSHFLDHYFRYRTGEGDESRQIPQFFTILPGGTEGRAGECVEGLLGESALFRSVTVGGVADIGRLERLCATGFPSGFLIDFLPGTDRAEVHSLMERFKESPLAERPVQFRNRLLQHFWECGTERIARSGRIEETVLFLKGREQPRALFLTEQALLLDQAEWSIPRKR